VADFSAVFKTVSPSVVGVVAGRRRDGRFQAQRTGTGIVWDAHHLVTNDHLVADAEEIRVRTFEGRVLRAKVVGNDGPTDLAVLSIKKPLPPITRGRAADLLPGQWVAAIGNPYGMDYSITVGVVSAVGRQTLPPGGPKYGDFIQADLNLNPGNSGGPLVDQAGRVTGLTTAIIGGANGLAFASPIEMIETVVERLLADGRFVRGFAGLFVKPVSWKAAQRAGLKRPQGARVRGVVKGGPAAKSGLQPGDIILRFANRPVDDAGGLPWLIAATPPGSAVALAVARGPERLELTLSTTEAR
jgi:serine protease Do